MSVKSIFKSTIPDCTYLFANGKAAVFSSGRYITGADHEVREMVAEVGPVGYGKSNHPFIYIDENEQTIDTSLQDAIAEAQKKAVAEVMASFSTANLATPGALGTAIAASVAANAVDNTASPATLAPTAASGLSSLSNLMAASSNSR